MKKWWILLVVLLMVEIIVFWPKREIEQQKEIVEIKNKPEVVSKIAIMADIHNDTESLDKALLTVWGEGVEAVIVAGDLTINGTREELLDVMAHLGESGIKYFAVPGNHDLYKNAWSGVFGREYQSIRIGNDKYILINNANWRGLGDDQKQWLTTELPECKTIKCLAVMHEPLENTFSKHIMGEYNKATASEAVWLKKILVDNNVLTGYSGHLHYSSSYTIDGWETVLVGAISKDRNTETPRYTEIEIDNDENVVNRVIVY